MKFTLTFKTPDVLGRIENDSEEEQQRCFDLAQKFVRYGELVSIEFDTEAQTATVVKVK